MTLKILKNKMILGLVLIVILIIFSYSKIKEYNTLKDAFVFSKDNIVLIWRLKKGEDAHEYHYKLSKSEINYLSDILTNSKLKKASINDCTSNALGEITILLDGRTRKVDDNNTSVEFKRGITLIPIDDDSVYVFLEINRLRDDYSFNVNGIVKKSYIIESKKLVEFIGENT